MHGPKEKMFKTEGDTWKSGFVLLFENGRSPFPH